MRGRRAAPLSRHDVRVALVVALVCVAGCTLRAPAPPLAERPIELHATPFHPQRTDQCGPAALTTVLEASGVDVEYETVQSRVYVPSRRGSLQLELLAASRAYDRLPVRVAARTAAVVEQLALGRPVLVMQNLGVAWLPRWHYAVVIGYLPETDEVLLRSGPEPRHRMSRTSFERTWTRAERWGFVVLGVDDVPAGLEPLAYLEEAAAFESLGRLDVARAAYARALEHWPDTPLAAVGLGNVRYAEGALEAAADAYRRALAIDAQDVAARNNLAQALADLGCRDEALAVIDAAPLVAGHPLADVLRATRDEIAARPDSRCPEPEAAQ